MEEAMECKYGVSNKLTKQKLQNSLVCTIHILHILKTVNSQNNYKLMNISVSYLIKIRFLKRNVCHIIRPTI